MKTKLLLLVSSIFIIPLFSTYSQDRCGTDEYTAKLITSLKKDAASYESYLAKKQEIEAFLDENWYLTKTSGSPFIIPVVVHVVYKNGSENISAEQIQSQIDALNRDYRMTNSDIIQTPNYFRNDAADSYIEFRLAKFDPNGAPTTGITRTQTSVQSFTVDNYVKKGATGGHDIWDCNKYLNIWVCDLIGGLYGYSSFPNFAEYPGDINGVVIDYKYFGTIGDLEQNFTEGRTAAHEIGHWLGLHHLWGDNIVNINCTDDDEVGDTPIQSTYNEGCHTFPSPSCGNVSDMFMNYMDYGYDNCIVMFTKGQRDRMQGILVKERMPVCLYLTATPSIVELNPTGNENATISIARNNVNTPVTWQVVSKPTWMDVTPTTGTNEGTIIAYASSNSTSQARSGYIEIKSNLAENDIISICVKQAASSSAIPNKYVWIFNQFTSELDGLPHYTTYGRRGLYLNGAWRTSYEDMAFYIPGNTTKITPTFTYVPLRPYDSPIRPFFKFYEVRDENYNHLSYKNYEENLDFRTHFIGECYRIYDANITANAPEYPGAGIQVGFRDPWLFDFDGSLGAKQNRPDNPVAYYESGSYSISMNNNQRNYGVFLNTGNLPLWDAPTYSAIANTQTITLNGKTTKFYFQNWTATNAILKDPSATETLTSFTDGDKIITANYKGSLITNKIESYSGNQRQIVDSYGYLHLVYQSMDKIWYERSSDNGATWELMNGGKPLNTGRGKDPSIDYYPNNQQIIIVYQDEYPSSEVSRIQAACFMGGALQFYSEVFPENTGFNLDFDEVSFKPVVAYATNDQIMVSWQWSGVWYREGTLSFFSYHSLIWNTDPNWAEDLVYNSINPTIVAAKSGGTTFHLAWEYPYSSIKYAKFTRGTGTNPPLVMSTVETPSTGCGFPVVFEPAISLSSNTNVLLVWKATPYSASTTRPVIYRSKTTSWSSFTQLGSYAVSANVGCPLGSSGYGVAWKEGSSSSTLNKIWIYGGIRNLSINGNHTKMLEGETSARSKVMTFEGGSSPFFITLSQPFSTIHKETFSRLCYGRQIVLRSDSLEIYAKLTDILLGNSPIRFNTRDSINTNAFIESEEFMINGSVNLSFNYMYGTTDSVEATRIFNGNNTADFVVDLIKTDQNGLTKTLKTISFNQNSSLSEGQKSLEISFNASHSGTYKIRITPKTNLEVEYYYSDLYNDESLLMKKNAESINFEFDQVPTVYALSQNYPNPFNPSTVISYDIPQASRVTLKVYDILGREVAGLVNEFKEAGRYNVKFDASHLSTGIYIYQLRANDYVSVKKMSFVK
jgi:hypothetical protein